MKKVILHLLLLLFILGAGTTDALAQKRKKRKKQKSEFEETLCKCLDKPVEERPRISVARFEAATDDVISRPGQVAWDGQYIEPIYKLGDELGVMLMNALSESDCFHLLESGNKLNDALYEIELAEEGVTKADYAPKSGEMYGAQLLITGEITEYESDFVNVFGIGIMRAHIGYILKIVDPETRTVVWSKSVERKFSKPAPILNGSTPIAIFGSKAMEDAVEYSIFESVDLLTKQTDMMMAYQDKIKERKADEQLLSLNVEDVSFEALMQLENNISTIENARLIGKSYKDGNGTISLNYRGSMDELVAELMMIPGLQMKVIEFNYDQLTLASTN